MDRKVKILGTMHLILGGGGMAACLAAYLCWIKLASDAHSLRTAHTLGQMMFMLSMFILLPSLVCGVGLLFEKSWAGGGYWLVDVAAAGHPYRNTAGFLWALGAA